MTKASFVETIKKNLFSIISISVCAIIMIMFLFTPEGMKGLNVVMRELRIRWLVAAAVSMVLGWILEGICINILARDVMRDWNYIDSFQIGMIGCFYNGVTPFASGGQPMQIYAMNKKGMDVGFATSVIAKRSLMYQTVLVIYAITLMCLRLPFFAVNVSNFAWLAVIGVASNGLFVFTILLFSLNESLTKKIIEGFINFFGKIKLLKNPDVRYKKIEQKLETFHSGIISTRRPVKVYFLTVLFTIVQIATMCFIPFCIYKSFNLSGARLLTFFAADSFVMMVSAFVPLPGASGGAEGSFYLFFSLFFTDGTIVPAILLWRIFTYYMNILVGGIISAIKPNENHRRKNKGDHDSASGKDKEANEPV